MPVSTPTCLGIVFIHGAGLAAWIWDDVAKRLPFPSRTIDFPGRGRASALSPATATLEAYVSSAFDQLRDFAPEKLVLVCHSIGALVGLDLADRLGDRVAGFVALSAPIPPPGRSHLQILARGTQTLMKLVLNVLGTKPPDAVIRDSLCADLGSEVTKRVLKNFVPESRHLYLDPTRYARVPRWSLYILLKYDRALTLAMQKTMVPHLRPQKTMELTAGHLAMLSEPDEVADAIRGYVRSLESLPQERQG